MISNLTRCIEVDRENEMMFIRRRQVSPREEEIDCEGENTDEEDEIVETVCETLVHVRDAGGTLPSPQSCSIMHIHARTKPRTREQVGKRPTDKTQQTPTDK